MSFDSERNTTKTDLAGRGKKTKPSTSRAPAKPSCLKLSAYKIHKIQHLVHSSTCVLYIMLRVCNGHGVVFCSQQHTAHSTACSTQHRAHSTAAHSIACSTQHTAQQYTAAQSTAAALAVSEDRARRILSAICPKEPTLQPLHIPYSFTFTFLEGESENSFQGLETFVSEF